MREKLIDYALPCMMAENSLKKVHSFMLDKNYDEATELVYECIKHSVMLFHSIQHMKKMQENSE